MTGKELYNKIINDNRKYNLLGNKLFPMYDIVINGKNVWYINTNSFDVHLIDKKSLNRLNYSIYGTPEESLTYKFAMANRKDFGLIKYVTDKDYVVNSYHVDPRENIDAFTKLKIEGEYLELSSGGAVSYVETLDLSHNKEVILTIMRWMYDNILYAEFNRKIGVCYECGYEGDIELIKTEDGQFQFKCPHCGNTDDSKMDVTGRLCGYLGKISSGNTNKGRLDDIHNRVIHLDCFSENI